MNVTRLTLGILGVSGVSGISGIYPRQIEKAKIEQSLGLATMVIAIPAAASFTMMGRIANRLCLFSVVADETASCSI